MTRAPDASTPSDAVRRRLLSLLAEGDLDGALQAGLMEYAASAGDDDAPIRSALAQLRTAWAARERHRAREARLARRAAERNARRAAATPPPADTPAPPPAAATTATTTATTAGTAPALPPAAAAALARARARAAGREPR